MTHVALETRPWSDMVSCLSETLSVLHFPSACPSAWGRERYSVKDAKRWFANDRNQAVGDSFENFVNPMCVEGGKYQ